MVGLLQGVKSIVRGQGAVFVVSGQEIDRGDARVKQGHRTHQTRLASQVDRTTTEQMNTFLFSFFGAARKEILSRIDRTSPEKIDSHHRAMLKRMFRPIISRREQHRTSSFIDNHSTRTTQLLKQSLPPPPSSSSVRCLSLTCRS